METNPTAPAEPFDLTKVAEKWQTEEGSRLLVINERGSLTRNLAAQIYEVCRHESDCRLDVILQSSGGDLDAAYKAVGALHVASASKVRVFVPGYAKSAATLLCLGADEIWMTPASELGPLDAQIADPRDPDSFMSALEEFRAVDYLRTLAFEGMDQMVQLLLRRTPMTLRNILPEARQFATAMVEPLYRQVDPIVIGSAHRALDISMEYGRRVMSRHGYAAWEPDQIHATLTLLTWKYPSHSFVIDSIEAKELGLNVQLMDVDREDDATRIISETEQGYVGFPCLQTPPEVPAEGIPSGLAKDS